MERKNTLLLTVIAVATLLVAVVGATFAYFASTYTQSGANQTVNVTTKTVTNVIYETGSKIELTNMDLDDDHAGDYQLASTGQFSVTASGSSDADTVTYNIKITVGTNTIKDATGTQGAQGMVMCKLYRGTTKNSENEQVGSAINCNATTNLATGQTFAVPNTGGAAGYYYKLEVYVWNDTSVDNSAAGKAYTATLSIDNLVTGNNNGGQVVAP